MSTESTTPAAAAEDQVYGNLTQVNDSVDPAPRASSPEAPRPPADEDGEAPAKPAYFGEDRRAQLYARQRDRAAGIEAPAVEVEKVDEIDPMLSFQPPFVRDGIDLPEAPAADAPPANAPKTYKLKVNHNELTATREQVVQMAGLDPEEAAGLPDSVIVRSAQIMEARRQALTEAKRFQSPEDRRETGAHQAPDGSDPYVEHNERDPRAAAPRPGKKELVQKLQFGDEEEAANALDQYFDARMHERQYQERTATVGQTIDEALSEFQTKNLDIVQNPRAMNLATVEALELIKSELIAAGGVPQKVAQLSQDDLVRAYGEATVAGMKVRPVADVLAIAEAHTRATLNMPRAPSPIHPAPSPHRIPSSLEQRTAAKRGMVQTPQRAGAQPVQQQRAPLTREASRTEAINQMRATRGQKPIGA